MLNVVRSVSRVRIIYILTTLFLVGLSLFTYIQVNKLFKAFSSMQHTTAVKESLSTISTSILEAETSKRGYLLSGNQMFLQRRDIALSELQRDLHVLDSLADGSPDQIQNYYLLKVALQSKLENIYDISNNGMPLQTSPSIQSNVLAAVQKMDSVSLAIDNVSNPESQRFEQQAKKFSRLSVLTPMYIIVLFLGAIVILFFSYFILNAELRQSQNLHASLVVHNRDREALAGELITANQELAFQNEEKEKRASELAVANEELGVQNENKEKLAAELIIANKELAYQNEEKEKRAVELFNTNKELQLFLNISSHDLQEPLRKIQIAASRIDEADFGALSPKGRTHFIKMQEAALSMQTLIEDLLTYSRTNTDERKFENVNLGTIIDEAKNELKEAIEEKHATIQVLESCRANIIPFQFRQLLNNILSNALKFSIPGTPPLIVITARLKPGRECHNDKLTADMEYCHISIADNGIGFEPVYHEKIFEVFQRLYGKEIYKGTGIGLAIVKKIVENHHGVITATGQLNKGATFDIYIPNMNRAHHG